jgi:hypothetical protein
MSSYFVQKLHLKERKTINIDNFTSYCVAFGLLINLKKKNLLAKKRCHKNRIKLIFHL